MEDQSKLTFKQMLSALLRSNRRHARYIQAFACLAVLVAVAVPLVMRQYGVAMTTTETRLSCRYEGNGAHTHNADCYDAYGNLVCPLPEKPFHTHTADCYATETVLVCGQAETEGHAHTDACYDEDGNLTCTIPEEPAHTHTDACYETRTTDQLICGMEETTEEHVHGPACFETVTVQLPDPEPETDPAADPAAATPAEPEATVASTPEEDPTPAQEFTDVLKKKDQDGNEYVALVVQVKAPQGALPKGSTMAVAHVDLNKKDDLTGLTAQEKLDDILRKEAGEEAAFVQTDAVDIAFKDAQGNRIDPAKKVEVRITTSMIRAFSDQRTAGDEAVANNSLLVLHVVDHQHTARTNAPDAELIRDVALTNQDENDRSTGHEDTILFEATEFSPYVVARVNNAANAPEAELEEEAQQTETEQQATTEASLEENAEATEEATSKTPAQTFSHSFSKSNGQMLMTVNVFAPEGAFPLGTTMQVKWVDAKQVEGAVAQAVSERTDGKLVDLRAVDITFTDADGQEVEPAVPITVTFASDLIDTADDSHVVHIDDQGNAEVVDALGAKELQSRDIADQADELVIESDQFSTYVVAVTTLHKELTASDGSTYDITVDAPAEAGIPQDAELQVREITPGGAGYDDYLYQAMSALGEDPSQAHPELARFFDIKIMSNGEEVHPQEAVKVSIQLADAPDLGEAVSSNAVHFQYSSEVKPQVLDATQEGDTTTFDANGFSVYGVIYTVDFHYEFNGQMYSYGIEGGDTVSLRELLVALNVVEPQDAQKFVSYISNVTFSNPELVAVAKVEEDTTSGALKEALGVTTQYSAQLRAEERDQMDARQLTAPDWALITLKAFDTTESLTITLANGDSVTIAVTDAQITKHFLSQDGTGYNITLNYEDDAQIPADADLFVREIEPGTTEYQSYLAQSVDQLDVESVRDISYARFFDIEIQDAHQNKIEPKAPVLVSIELDDGADIEAAKDLHVVHYADDGTEVLEGIGVNQDGTVMTYLQNGFSVTGTVVTRPAANEQYMVLIDYNGSYYIVNNDGSLTNVGTSATGTVEVDEPMMWTYDGRNIYHHTEQVSFNMNQLAADFYNKYIDPTDRADAISTDRDNPGTTLRNINETYFDWNTWSNQTFTYQVIQNRPQQNVTQITLTNEHIKSANSNQYVGVVEDPDGTLRLVGGVSEANAATVRLAAANEVLKTNYLNHTVNHIDISIEGEAAVDVPLAYGSYYDANGNEVKTVTSPESLHLDSGVVGITLDDMKRAVITAYTKDADGTTHEIDNAFVVNGYSANESTEFSTQQVRIEGEFRVSTIDPVSKQYYDRNKQRVYQDRLNHKIYYKVTAYKTITYNLIDPELGQLYDEFGNPMTVNVDVAFSASFDYWDPRNECPPVRWDSGEWSRGGIPDHNLSGMDFVLGGNSEGDAESRAVEIKKIIEDENGSPIAIQTSLDHSFMLHYYKDETDTVTGPGNASNLRNSAEIWDMNSTAYENYNPRTDEDHRFVDAQNVRVRVGTSGVGQSYTYDFNSGMFYITEDTSTVPDEITGADGDTWYYESTVIETEYVRRYGGFDTTLGGVKNSHKSETYVDKTQNYDSRAEVLGRYNNAPNAQDVPSYDQNPDNEFLEFTVHNVYRKSKSETTELNVTKSWVNEAPDDVTEVYVKIFRKIEGGNPEDVTDLIKADKDNLSLYVTRANFDVDNAWIVVHKNDDNTWENVKVKSMPIGDNDGHHYTYYIEEVGYKQGGTVHRSVSEFDPTYTPADGAELEHKPADDGSATQSPINQFKVINTQETPVLTSYTVKKTFENNAYPTDGTVQVVIGLQQSTDGQNWTDAGVEPVTLPKLNRDSNPETDATWYASADAWTYTWDELPATKKTGGNTQNLYYRAVELSAPSWFTVTDATGQQVTITGEGEQATAAPLTGTVNNAPKTYELTVNKQWTKDGEELNTWPSNVTSVEGKVVKYWHVAAVDDSTNPPTITPSDAFWTEEDQTTFSLTSDNPTYSANNLVSYEYRTIGNTADDDDLIVAAKNAGITLERGKTYLIVYTYGAEETAVNWSDGKQTVAQEVSGTQNGNAITATFTNDVTDVSVKKEWRSSDTTTPDTEWPAGAEVNYKIMRVATYTDEDGRTTEFVPEVFISQSATTYQGPLNSAYSQRDYTNLPTMGAVELAAGNEYGLVSGVYPVTYRYYVQEDVGSVAPTDSAFEYTPNEAQIYNGVATLINEYTHIKVDKQWVRNGETEDFPANYKVNWKVVQKDQNGNVINDNFYVAYVEDVRDHRLMSGEGNNSYELNYLPAKGTIDGREVTFTYDVYEVPENSEAPNNEYPFQEILATSDESGNYIITNDLTKVTVNKVWDPKTEPGTEVVVQLYATTDAPANLETVDVKITLDDWGKDTLNNDRAPLESGSVTGTLNGSDGSTRSFTLNPDNNWSQVFAGIPKYSEDSEGNQVPIQYSISTTDTYLIDGIIPAQNAQVKGDGIATPDDYTIHLSAIGQEDKVQFKFTKGEGWPSTDPDWQLQITVKDKNGGVVYSGNDLFGNESISSEILSRGEYTIEYLFVGEHEGYTIRDYSGAITSVNETGVREYTINLDYEDPKITFTFARGEGWPNNNPGWEIMITATNNSTGEVTSKNLSVGEHPETIGPLEPGEYTITYTFARNNQPIAHPRYEILGETTFTSSETSSYRIDITNQMRFIFNAAGTWPEGFATDDNVWIQVWKNNPNWNDPDHDLLWQGYLNSGDGTTQSDLLPSGTYLVQYGMNNSHNSLDGYVFTENNSTNTVQFTNQTLNNNVTIDVGLKPTPSGNFTTKFSYVNKNYQPISAPSDGWVNVTIVDTSNWTTVVDRHITAPSWSFSCELTPGRGYQVYIGEDGHGGKSNNVMYVNPQYSVVTIENNRQYELSATIGFNGESVQSTSANSTRTMAFRAPALRANASNPDRVIEAATEHAPETTGNHEITVIDKSNLPEGAVAVGGEVTLDSSGSWQHEWDNLPKVDSNGDPIYYYVVEKRATTGVDGVTSTTATYDIQRDETTGEFTITITNTTTKEEPKTGTIVVKKVLEGLSSPDTEFKFYLQRASDGKYMQENGHWSDTVVWMTIHHDQTYTFTNLPLGNYIVKEQTDGDGGAKTAITGYELVEADSVTGTAGSGISVIANGTSEFTLENAYTPAPIRVTKEWQNIDGSSTAPDGATVQFQLYKNGTESVGDPITLDGTVDENGEPEAWVAEWKDMPRKDGDDPITYIVKEIVDENGYSWAHYKVTHQEGITYTEGDTNTITNVEQITQIHVTKLWKDVNGSVVTNANLLKKTEINFTLYQSYTDNAGEKHSAVYTYAQYAVGETDPAPLVDGKGSISFTEGTWQTVDITSLPQMVQGDDGNWYEAKYYVVEDGIANVTPIYQLGEGGSDKPEDAATSDGTITIVNTEDSNSLRVEKTWDDLGDNTPYELTFKIQSKLRNAGDDVEWADIAEAEPGAGTYKLAFDGSTYTITQIDGTKTYASNMITNLDASKRYRVVELSYKVNPDTDDEISKTFDTADFVEGTSTTPDNGLTWVSELSNTLEKVTIDGTKTWKDNKQSHADPKLILERTTDDATSEEATWEKVTATKLDPTKPAQAPAGEEVGTSDSDYTYLTPIWSTKQGVRTYTYRNLPKYSPEGKEYTYRVTEAHTAGFSPSYDNEGNEPSNVAVINGDTGTGSVNIINTPVGKLKVQKSWFAGADASTLQSIEFVIEWSFDKTSETGWHPVAEAPGFLPNGDGCSANEDGVVTLEAQHDATGATTKLWQWDSGELPRFMEDPDDSNALKEVYYRVRETKINGVEIDHQDVQVTWEITQPDPTKLDEAKVATLTIKNDKPQIAISGTKTWITDDPTKIPAHEEFELHLYQYTAAQAEDESNAGKSPSEYGTVVNATPTWTYNDETHVWSYVYTGLDRYYEDFTTGNKLPWLYYVEEEITNAEKAAHFVGTVATGQVQENGSITDYNFINTDKTSIVVIKQWMVNEGLVDGDYYDSVRDTVNIQLYRRGDGTSEAMGEYQIKRTVEGTTVKWELLIDDLPKYYHDAAGELQTYSYYVVEQDAAPWHVKYSNELNNEGKPTNFQDSAVNVVADNPEEPIYIQNSTYTYELPMTGGPGTLLHALCGLALFAAAGYVGLASKRSARKEVA